MDTEPYDLLNLVRIASMLVFITVFLGILVWLMRPGAKRHSQDASMIPLRDDAGSGERPIERRK